MADRPGQSTQESESRLAWPGNPLFSPLFHDVPFDFSSGDARPFISARNLQCPFDFHVPFDFPYNVPLDFPQDFDRDFRERHGLPWADKGYVSKSVMGFVARLRQVR
jgi:hypothetical protein